MTAHIFITSIALILFTCLLKKILRNKSKPFSWGLIAMILFLVLPISFGGMSVIAHFLFENSTDNLLWFAVVYAFLFLVAGYLLFRAKPFIERKNYFALLLLWLIFLVWYCFALTQSHYESGPTPEITDTMELLFYWLSIQLFIVILFWLLITYSLKERNKYSLTVALLLSLVYIPLFLTIFE